MVRLVSLIAVLAAFAEPARAQDLLEEYKDFQNAMMAAQAKANRPDDHSLSCEDLAKEFAASMGEPSFRIALASPAEIGKPAAPPSPPAPPQATQVAPQATGLPQSDAAPSGMSGPSTLSARTTLQMAAQIMAMTFVPGAGMASIADARAWAAAQQRQTAENVQRIRDYGRRLVIVMPQIMRGQRLLELGQGRQCHWANSGDVNPPKGRDQ